MFMFVSVRVVWVVSITQDASRFDEFGRNALSSYFPKLLFTIPPSPALLYFSHLFIFLQMPLVLTNLE